VQIQELEQNPFLIATKYILEFYFGEIDTQTLHSFSNKKSQSFGAEDALEILNALKLSVVQREATPKEIPKHFFPSIIYNDAHGVCVLLGVGAESAEVFNTKTLQKESLTVAELEKYNQAILVFKEGRYTKEGQKTSKSWFFEPMKSHYRAYIEIAFLTLFINIFALAVPLFSMSVYDRVVPNQAYETLFVLSIGVLILLAFDLLFKYVRTHILEGVAKKLGLYWEEMLMKKMLFVDAKERNI